MLDRTENRNKQQVPSIKQRLLLYIRCIFNNTSLYTLIEMSDRIAEDFDASLGR